VKKFETLASWFEAYKKRNGIEYDTSYLNTLIHDDNNNVNVKWSSNEFVSRGSYSSKFHIGMCLKNSKIQIAKRFEIKYAPTDEDKRVVKYIESHEGFDKHAKFFESSILYNSDGSVTLSVSLLITKLDNGHIIIETSFPESDIARSLKPYDDNLWIDSSPLQLNVDSIVNVKKWLKDNIVKADRAIECVSKHDMFNKFCVNYDSHEIAKKCGTFDADRIDTRTGNFVAQYSRSQKKQAERLLGDLLVARLHNIVMISIIEEIEKRNLINRLLERDDLLLVDRILTNAFLTINEKYNKERNFVMKYVDELKKIENKPIEDPIEELDNNYKLWNKNEKSVDSKI